MEVNGQRKGIENFKTNGSKKAEIQNKLQRIAKGKHSSNKKGN